MDSKTETVSDNKFTEGQKVLAGPFKLPMRVVSFVPCIGGIWYKLAFYRKDGEIDKRRNYRFFFERDINSQSPATIK